VVVLVNPAELIALTRASEQRADPPSSKCKWSSIELTDRIKGLLTSAHPKPVAGGFHVNVNHQLRSGMPFGKLQVLKTKIDKDAVNAQPELLSRWIVDASGRPPVRLRYRRGRHTAGTPPGARPATFHLKSLSP
jgi:hypothetical protein